MNAAMDMIQAHPEISAIYGLSDEMVLGDAIIYISHRLNIALSGLPISILMENFGVPIRVSILTCILFSGAIIVVAVIIDVIHRRASESAK